MLCELVILTGMFGNIFSAQEEQVMSDITRALQNIKEMESEILRFYKRWDALSKGIAAQGKRRALESCTRDHAIYCTPEKRQALSICIDKESKVIHDGMVKIYDNQIRTPWESEFQKLRNILENPTEHEGEIVDTIWTVHQDTYSEGSVRNRFYTSLVNFQPLNVAPNLYPIDKVYKLCLEREFP